MNDLKLINGKPNRAKKLAIVGKGTAGALAAAHANRWLKPEGWEIEWVYDPSTPTQAVGEGSTLVLPTALFQNIDFHYNDLEKLDGSFKGAIYKKNWKTVGHEYRHHFPPPHVSYHFNALKLQGYIFDRLEGQVSVVESNVSNSSELDADYVLDCSGAPKDKSGLVQADSIPVNSVYVTQCYWDHVRFQETLTIARPYGWVFGIPLRNRCSIGYMYNNSVTSLDEVKKDVQQIFADYDLTPSNDTNSFSFGNYYRKENMTDKVAYSGNASFFLEPLEATSIGVMDTINRQVFDYLVNGVPKSELNARYKGLLTEIQGMMALHYFAADNWDNDFWNLARDKATKFLKSERQDGFETLVKLALNSILTNDKYPSDIEGAGTWGIWSYAQNIQALGLTDKLFGMYSEKVAANA